MLISSLSREREFAACLGSVCKQGTPSISRLVIVIVCSDYFSSFTFLLFFFLLKLKKISLYRLQKLIESAWSAGFDTPGADQLGRSLHNTRKWIGATEIIAFLTHLGIKADLVDFHIPTANDGSHPKLFAWVVDYFRCEILILSEALFLT